jgi:hypothetical protein
MNPALASEGLQGQGFDWSRGGLVDGDAVASIAFGLVESGIGGFEENRNRKG